MIICTQELVLEVCHFFQYANALFSFHTQLDIYQHFRMYIHRIALSVVLPEQHTNKQAKHVSVLVPPSLSFPAIPEDGSETCSLEGTEAPVRNTNLSRTLPRRMKQMLDAPLEPIHKPRPHSSAALSFMSRSLRSHRKNVLTRQPFSLSERESSPEEMEVVCYMTEWRKLNLSILRQRIQRLVVLMDLSEPGTIPDSGMLASLIDLVRAVYNTVCTCTYMSI